MFKKIMFVIVALLMCVTVNSAMAVQVSDSFENHTNGDPLVTLDINGDEVSALSPDVGPSAWTRYVGQAGSSAVVSDDVAYSGTQSAKHVRDNGGLAPLMQVSGGVLSPGFYVLSGALYTGDDSSSGNLALTTDSGGFITAISTASYSGGSAAHYTQVLNNGTAYAIAYKDPAGPGGGGIYMNPGEWTLFELEMTVVDAGGGMLDGTAELFYTQGAGPRLTSSSAAFDLAAWNAAEGVNLFTGANGASGPAVPLTTSTVYWDDVQITPEPATMMLLGLGGLGLIRRKRA